MLSNIPFLALFFSSSSSGNSSSANVGTEGGVVQSLDGSFSLEVPSGALSETRLITVTKDASPIGNIPEGYGKGTAVYKFEPEGLTFIKPASFTIYYDQGQMTEGGFEERAISFYYVKNDSTLEKMNTLSVDYAQNKIVVEVKHFSFGVGLSVQVWLVASGVISNSVPVSNIANNVIAELSDFAANGYASVGAYFQANASVLGPFLNQLVAVLGHDPVSTVFPNEDFDGDGISNSEDPYVASTGPQVSIVSSGSTYVSANGGAINTTQFVWKSTKAGTYSIRKGATNCSTGTVINSGSVIANTNQSSGTLTASSDLLIGSNIYRICVVSSGVTGAITQSFVRDDTAPTVSVTPSSGSYGNIQNITLNCGDVGGAGCFRMAYTTNGTTPAFDSTCAITNGLLYSSAVVTPDASITTLKFKSCDSAGNVSVLYTESYIVDSILPSITINSVLPGSTIQGGVSPQLNWQSDKSGNYTIKIGSDCSSGILASGTNVSGSVVNGVAIATTVSAGAQLSDGARKVNICVSNLINNVGTSASTITVDSVIPAIAVTPSSGTYNPVQFVTATCTDATSGCQKIAYTTNGTDPSFDVSGIITNGSLYTGSLATPNNTTTSYKFIARDNAGLVSGITSTAYNIGTPPVSIDFNTSSTYIRVGSVNSGTIPTQLTLTMSSPATSDTVIGINSSDISSLSVTNNGVTILTGQTSANVLLTGIVQNLAVTLSATYNGVTRTTSVRVVGASETPQLASMTSVNNSVPIGSGLLFMVNLDIPASSGGEMISLTLSPSVSGTVPAVVTVPQNQISANFTFNAMVGNSTTVTATLGMIFKSLNITIY